MKTTNTANKTNSISKLLRSILSLVMVLALLVGFSTMLVGCSKDKDEDQAGNAGGNKNDPAQYEGLEDEEYLQKLSSNYFGAAIDEFGKLLTTKNGSKVDLTLNVGDDLLDMLTGGQMDLSFLSKINMSIDAGMKNDLGKGQLALGLNGQNILTLNVLMNMADSVLYLGAPDLNDTYLKLDMEELMQQQMGDGAMVGAAMSPAMLSTLTEALPDGDTLAKLLKRYVDLAIAELDNVKQSTTTLELDGLKQECTQLTLKIYEEDLMKVAKAVLTAAKDDAELKQALVDFAEAIENLTGQDMNADGIEASFEEAIEDLLEELNEKEDFDTESFIQLITYVDGSHNIIGHALSMVEADDDVELLRYYTVTEGDKFAFTAVADGMDLKISGSGTVKSGKTSGTYDVSVDGEKAITLKTEDVTAEGGTVTITLSDALLEELDLDALPFKKPALEIKLDGDTAEINLLAEGKLLVGIELKISESNGPNLSIPSNAVDVTDTNKLQQWAGNLNLNKLIKNLEKAGVPSELLNNLPIG